MYRKKIALSLALLTLLSLLCACGTSGSASSEEAESGETQTISEVTGSVSEDTEPPDTQSTESGGGSAAEMILGAYSTKNFSNEAVPDELLTQILQAGIQAPSAVNTQPWQFIVVNNSDLRASILNGINDGCALVLVTVPTEDYMMGGNSQFAAGTAAESMYLMAQALGLGAHMYTMPLDGINGSVEMRESLGMSSDFEVAVVLCFGYIENEVDAISGATTRNDLESFISFVE